MPGASTASLTAAPAALAYGKSAPAGGAIGQVIIAAAGAVLTAVMLILVAGHRTGRLPIFARLAAVSERVSGLGGWAALPGIFPMGALMIAVFGMWDVSIHLDKGRDPGPLANPAHYFILIGLFGVLFAGWQGGGSVIDRLRRTAPGHLRDHQADPGVGSGRPRCACRRAARCWACRSSCPKTAPSR